MLLVLQDEGCWLTARCSSPASGLPVTLRRGIGEQTAFPAPGCLPRGQRVGMDGNRTRKGAGGGLGSITWNKEGTELSRGAEGL